MNEQHPRIAKTRILLIEDDPSQSALIKKRLSLAGFEVVVCQDVESGLAQVGCQEFAVAVVDLALGEQSGLEFVRDLARAPHNTRVIIHTADASFASAKAGANMGIFAYVEKGQNDKVLIDFCHRAGAAYLSDHLAGANAEIAFQLRLLDAVNQGIIATRVNGKISYWNRFSEQLTGLSQSEAIGRSIFDFFVMSPGDLAMVQSQLESGNSWQGECEFRKSSEGPEATPIRVAASGLRNARDVHTGSVFSYHDLTEVKANEKRLERRAKLLSLNALLGRLAVEIADRDTFLVETLNTLNRSMPLRFGHVLSVIPSLATCKRIASIGNVTSEALGRGQLTDLKELSSQNAVNGFRIPFFENERLVASIECVFEQARSIGPDERDFLESIAALVTSVLQRNWSNHLRHSLFENSLDGVLIADDHGRFTAANDLAATLLGYPQAEIIQISLADLLPAERDPNAQAMMQRLLREGQVRGEIELIRKDQRVILVEFLAVSNILPDVHIAHLRDITERAKAEKISLEQKDQLAHVQRTAIIGQMAAVLAHEINQPLGAISNYSGGLLCGLDANSSSSQSRELYDTLGLIHSEAIRAGAIVNRLRKFIAKDSYSNEIVDANACIRDTLKILRNLLSSSNVVVKPELNENLPPIQIDQIRFQQVIVNVIKNSVESMLKSPSKGRVLEIKTSQPDHWGQIEISDTGPRVTATEFESLFRPYFTTKADGLGMGLCLSQTIVAQHFGTMTMTQLEPNGMLTTIRIPLC